MLARFAPALLVLALFGACAPSDPGPTYLRDVQPIVQSHCAQCHREGGIGPMSLTSLEGLRAYSAPIRLQLNAGTMPPWPADNACAEYLPNGALADADKATLLAWLDAGAPEGHAPSAAQ